MNNTVEILGDIQAGFDVLANEGSKYSLDIKNYVLEKPNSSIFVRVNGDSMIEAGIFPGDLAVVEKSNTPKLGDIIIAKIDSKYTIKYFKKDSKNRVYLEPANSMLTKVYPTEELEIFGVLKTIIRKY